MNSQMMEENTSLIKSFVALNITTTGFEEEREFYNLYEEKDWIRIKSKTRQLRLDEMESDFSFKRRVKVQTVALSCCQSGSFVHSVFPVVVKQSYIMLLC